MTAAAPARNGTTKFVPGFEPEAIALKFAAGKSVHSDFGGDQILFTLTDDRRWYCDPRTAKTIEQMRIQPGEVFVVCKTETRRGNQRVIEIEITAVVVPEEPAPSPPAPSPHPNKGGGAGSKETTTNCHQNNVTTARMPAAVAATAVPAADERRLPQLPPTGAPVNGNGETSADQLARCYRSAIDIVANAVLYAKAQGLVMAPCFEDVRCAAATLCIAEQQGRRL